MKIIVQNKKARFQYEILKTYEAGIILTGSEIKSVRNHKMNIQDSFAKFIKQEIFLINSHISPYEHSSYFNHTPTRMRKLLLNKKELRKLLSFVQEKGVTIIPLKAYFNNKNLLKVEIATARGKKLFDKRNSLKEKDLQHKINKQTKILYR